MQLIPVRLDIEGFRRNILRAGTPERTYFYEHGESAEFKDEVVRRFDLNAQLGVSPDAPHYLWQREIALERFLGHEVFRVSLPHVGFSSLRTMAADGRVWANLHSGPIRSREDLESFAWPDPGHIDFSQLEWYERFLPQDMGVMIKTTIWEAVRGLLGYERFCYQVYDDPALVDQVVRRVGEYYLAFTHAVCDFRCVSVLSGSDDLGFRTGTIVAPHMLETMILPWHMAMAQCAHQHGKFYFLHSCGKLDAIMDTLIDDVRIDAKHSFEDVIEPVTEAKKRWGNRVALLGGLDVDFVTRSDEPAIRRRVREVLDVCMPGGGYCLGLGNWVTNYIPVDNYLVVLDEGRRYGQA